MIFCQGTGRDVGGPISFLAYSFGSPNWCQLGLSGHSCYTPRLVAMKATLGDFCVLDASQFLEKRYDDPRIHVSQGDHGVGAESAADLSRRLSSATGWWTA